MFFVKKLNRFASDSEVYKVLNYLNGCRCCQVKVGSNFGNTLGNSRLTQALVW